MRSRRELLDATGLAAGTATASGTVSWHHREMNGKFYASNVGTWGGGAGQRAEGVALRRGRNVDYANGSPNSKPKCGRNAVDRPSV